jgi:hypothetical protein
MKISNPIPEGGVLYRHFYLSDKDFDTKIKAAAGKILQDPGIVSCSHSENTWSGNYLMEIHCAKGARGLYADGFSSNSSELETLLPPNSRFIINKVETGSFSKGANVKIVCTMMPTESFQFYS